MNILNKLDKLTAEDRDKLQTDLLKEVSEEIKFDITYILLTIFSTIITTLGLLIDSTAVVIGGMLIAPLFWPIMGLTLSTVTTRRRLLGRSAIMILVSTSLVLLISTLLTFILPYQGITPEIALRTNPTLLDLLIALSVSVIGVAALYFPKISQTASGVAVSISLLPPLCVAGIGLALSDFNIFWNSFLLFGANVGAIVFAGVVTLYLLKFRPKKKEEKERLMIGMISSIVFLILLSIPLTIYFRDSITQTRVHSDIEQELRAQFMEITEDARVETVVTQNFSSFDDSVMVEATVFLPEGFFLTVPQQDEIVASLSSITGKTVDLQLNLVNTLLLRKQEDENIQSLRREIESFIAKELTIINSEIILDNTIINFPENFTDTSEPIDILLSLKDFGETQLTFDQKQTLEERLVLFIDHDTNLNVELVPIRKLSQPSDIVKLESSITNVLEQDLNFISPNIAIGELSIVNFAENSESANTQITAQIYVPSNVDLGTINKNTLESHLSEETEEQVVLILQVITVENL